MINTINVLYNQQDNIMSYKNNADILTWKRVIENLQKKTDETVTEYNKAQQSRQSKNIKEGTWAIPETPEQVIKLKNLLKNPLDAATALNELGDVFGDDELFDTLEDMKENEPDTDVRHVVISRLKEMNFIKEVREGYKVLPPMDSKYVERDGLEGPFTTLSGKVVYYDPKEGKYYDPDTDMYMSYDEWNAHNSDQSGMTEWVQEPHEGQKWTGQEKNFIHDLCKRHDGIQMQWPKPQTGADGIKGPSPLWDEGKIMSNDADLQKLLSWVEKNKHDVESYFKSDFRVYSNKDKGQSQSDGNQVLDNIRAKILGESLELSESMINEVPWHRTHTVGNTTTSVNSRTGGIKATQVVGNPAGAHTIRSVNNHFNADGSRGQASATTTVGNKKVSVSGQIGGGVDPTITVKPIVKPKPKVNEPVTEELEYSQTAEEMAKELGMSMDEFWELAERVGVDQYGGLTKDNYEDVTAHIVDNAERYKQVHIFRKAGEFDGDK